MRVRTVNARFLWMAVSGISGSLSKTVLTLCPSSSPHIIKLYLLVDCVFSTVKIIIAVIDNNNRVNAKSNGSHDTDPDTRCL